jgi:hypothetical protein
MNFRKRLALDLSSKHNAAQLSQVVNQEVGFRVLQRVAGQSVSDSAGGNPSVASGLDIDVRIAHHERALARCCGIEQNLLDAYRMRFLLLETVPAVDDSELVLDLQTLQYSQARLNWLVGQDSQPQAFEPIQGLSHSGV